MFQNPRRSRQARKFTKNVPKVLDLKSSSEEIFSENWRWVSLIFNCLNNGQMANTFIIIIHSCVQLGNFESASNHCNKLQNADISLFKKCFLTVKKR